MFSIQSKSIKQKLQWVITFTSCAGLLLAGTAFLAYDFVSFRRQMVQDLSGLAQIIGSNSTAALLFGDDQASKEILSALRARPRVVSGYLLSQTGETLAAYRREAVPAPTGALTVGHRFENNHLTLVATVFLEGEAIGTVSLTSDMEEYYSRFWIYSAAVLAVMLVAAFVTFLLSSRIQRVISRPIGALADAAKAVSIDKDYSVRVEKQSSDELGMLTDAFNNMLVQIQRRDEALQAAQSELERRVDERTRELRDEVNEREQAEATLRQRDEELRQSQKLEAMGRLAGGIAHDFNNLLTVINGYSDVLLPDLDPHDPMRKKILAIKKAGDTAASLTQRLLAFGRRQLLAPEVLEINTIFANMHPMLRGLTGERISVNSTLSPDLGRVTADRGQIDQVILNLVFNARDAMPMGGELHIETANVDLDGDRGELATDAPPVMLQVSDTGCGIDDATLTRIFEPFFTTKPKGRGTGLGLSTVYGIVKQCEGSIDVTSDSGGTTFRIYLPRTEETTTVSETAIRGPHLSAKEEIVLLVEDDMPVRDLTDEILSDQGYTVLSAAHPQEALSICNDYSGTIHLMLTDVVMPHMNGPELYQQLAPIRPNMRVLYMSGYADQGTMDDVALDWSKFFIKKPFSREGLVLKVREILDKSMVG